MKTINDIETIIQENQAVMLYFSAPTCNVCHALKPKLFEAMESNFEVFEKVSIDISEAQDVAAHFGVFTIPTIIVFLEGKEFFKKSRNMSIDEVIKEIQRPYEIMLS